MKKIIVLIFITVGFIGKSKLIAQQNFHSFSAETILGDTISLSNFYGKKVMVVNTASFCGYTPQFAQLEQLYLQYQSNNFEIIGFPCNNFGNQDPNSDSLINEFCTDNYNVTFQMMSRVDIAVGDTASVYKWLQRSDLNGVADVSVSWNFNKFLIDEQGNWVTHYFSQTLPNDPAIIDWILSPSPILTKIEHNKKSSKFSIFHNNNKLIINGDFSVSNTMNCSIYDLSGKLIYSKQNHPHNNSLFVDTENLNDGIYFATIRTNDFTQTQKFIVRNN
jgi:glutathione peroxidase